MAAAAPSKMLTAEDIAEELRVSVPTAYRLMEQMLRIKLGRCVRVRREALDAFLRRRRNQGKVAKNRTRRAAAPRASVVYFIQCGNGGPIKIGFTDNIRERVSRLQMGNPEPLIVLAVTPGDRMEETALAHQFRHLHIRGEWYRPGLDLLAYIQAHVIEEQS